MSLDFLAFSLIIFTAIKSEVPGIKSPSILGTMAEDATWYFLVIFTAHIAFELTLNLGRVSMVVFLFETKWMMCGAGLSAKDPNPTASRPVSGYQLAITSVVVLTALFVTRLSVASWCKYRTRP